LLKHRFKLPESSRQDKDSHHHPLHPARDQMHCQRAYSFANVTLIDGKVGQPSASLDAKRYLDKRALNFTSDHGDALAFDASQPAVPKGNHA